MPEGARAISNRSPPDRKGALAIEYCRGGTSSFGSWIITYWPGQNRSLSPSGLSRSSTIRGVRTIRSVTTKRASLRGGKSLGGAFVVSYSMSSVSEVDLATQVRAYPSAHSCSVNATRITTPGSMVPSRIFALHSPHAPPRQLFGSGYPPCSKASKTVFDGSYLTFTPAGISRMICGSLIVSRVFSEHRDDVGHVDVADFLARDTDLRDRRERDVVPVERSLDVEDRLAPVLLLCFVFGNVEPRLPAYRFASALHLDEVGRQLPEAFRGLEQHRGQEVVARADLLGDQRSVLHLELRVVPLDQRKDNCHVPALVPADVGERFPEHRLARAGRHLVENGGRCHLAHKERREYHREVVPWKGALVAAPVRSEERLNVL